MADASGLGWKDVEAVASKLHERYSKIDPLTVNFKELSTWVPKLEGPQHRQGL